MKGFIKRCEELPVSEIWLADIEEGKERVEIIRALSQRISDIVSYPVKICSTINRREALEGADFVVTQFRVGQLWDSLQGAYYKAEDYNYSLDNCYYWVIMEI